MAKKSTHEKKKGKKKKKHHHKKPKKREKMEMLENQDSPEEEKQKRTIHLTWNLFWWGLCAACIATNIVSVVFKRSIATYAAGFTAMVVSVLVSIRQLQLRDQDAMRNVQNDIRKEVNRLQEENNVLTGEINKLTSEVNRLKETEDKLAAVAKQQGLNVAQLVELTKENGEILEQMRKATKSETLQSLFDIVMYADVDQDFTIGEEEVPELILKLGADPRVEIDPKKLKKKVKKAHGSLPILELVDDLMAAGETPEPDNVFWFPPKFKQKPRHTPPKHMHTN